MKTIPGTILKILDVPTYSESEKPPVMVRSAMVKTEKGIVYVDCEKYNGMKVGDEILLAEEDLIREIEMPRVSGVNRR